MTIHTHDYDANYDPAMPVIEILVQRQSGESGTLLRAIVDSGADATLIPRHVLEQLGARKVQTKWLVGMTGVRLEVDLFTVVVQIGSDVPRYLEVIAGERRDVIIAGRDLLKQYTVTLDAPGSTVIVSA